MEGKLHQPPFLSFPLRALCFNSLHFLKHKLSSQKATMVNPLCTYLLLYINVTSGFFVHIQMVSNINKSLSLCLPPGYFNFIIKTKEWDCNEQQKKKLNLNPLSGDNTEAVPDSCCNSTNASFTVFIVSPVSASEECIKVSTPQDSLIWTHFSTGYFDFSMPLL